MTRIDTKYQIRVAKFFDLIGIHGKTLEQKANTLTKEKIIRIGAVSNILKFIYFQRERIDKNEISGATLRN
jgi:hypothetical protein